MTDIWHLTFGNAILPLIVLVTVTVGLPALLAPRTVSQVRLAVVMVATGLVVWTLGAAIMAWLYAQVNGAARAGVWYCFERSALMGLLWGPVLALVWLMRAQGVETRRGLLMGGMRHEAVD